MKTDADSIKKNISNNIVKYREKAGLSQKEFAQLLNTSPSRVSNWEQGANCPSMDILFEVCRVLDVSINDIYGIYPSSSIILSYEEQNLIKGYRLLDPPGREHVDTVLMWESDRTSALKEHRGNTIPLMEIQASRDPSVTLPYWESGVSAGNGIYQLNDTESIPLRLWKSDLVRDADYIIKVHGASMEPDYHDGNKVLVDRDAIVQIGEVGIFVKNGETFIKELGADKLISRNTQYPVIEVNDYDNVVCLGKVIGILADSMIAPEK